MAGQVEILIRQLERRFGPLSAELRDPIFATPYGEGQLAVAAGVHPLGDAHLCRGGDRHGQSECAEGEASKRVHGRRPVRWTPASLAASDDGPMAMP